MNSPQQRSTPPGLVCPTAEFPFRIGGKWTGMVIIALVDGPLRFTELRTTLTTVTAKVLTQTLRDMERDGLASRHDYTSTPPRVEYELTDLGRSLLTLIAALRAWSDVHLDDLLSHRASYDHAIH